MSVTVKDALESGGSGSASDRSPFLSAKVNVGGDAESSTFAQLRHRNTSADGVCDKIGGINRIIIKDIICIDTGTESAQLLSILDDEGIHKHLQRHHFVNSVVDGS